MKSALHNTVSGMIHGLIFWLLACTAFAHDARPISLEIRQQPGEFQYASRLRVPDSLQQLPGLLLPEGCTAAGDTTSFRLPAAATRLQAFTCRGDLRGSILGLHFPRSNPSLSTVVRVILADRKVHTTILAPGTTQWRIPEKERKLQIAGQYTWLGVKHILLGVDHLLFILCLLFVAGRAPKRIFVTVTGFTLAHSLTLALSVLELVALPIAAVESAIALSIVFLALEILRADPASWTFRYPVSVAASFGLLHGFGFASVLREIGLPQVELPLALLCFNLGVEIGQLLFLALILLLAHLSVRGFNLPAGRHGVPGGTGLRVSASYLVGSLASYWLIDRTLAFWPNF